ncbi:alpha/beta fold hydrolase [Duganella hordei]|uniref:alpha/beta fold hydrolase n=1 Tax=Duganella hordei TaxID=2865934 RepID=UPI0030EAD7F4
MNIASNGIRIHVEEQGQGELSLVFLHYWGGSSRTWRHVTAALASSYRTVAVDHRGWGQSDAPMSGYGLEDLAADALGVIEALDLKSYVLVGHSMGGKVAQLLASRQPAGLAGLVLVAPSPPSPMAMPVEARERMAHAYSSRQAVEMTLDHVLTARALSAEDREQVIADSLSGSPLAKAAWPQYTSQEDITAQVTAIRVPTLVIAGEDDRVDPPAVLREELMPRIAQARLHVLPGVGHLSPLEAAGDLAELIRDFATLAQPRRIPSH